jgi:L-alanine-DL-glutamate epimerase-like enolase superfamily enzyme
MTASEPRPALTGGGITLASGLSSPIVVKRAHVRLLAVPAEPIIAAVDRDLTSVHMVVLRLEGEDGETGCGCLWSLDQSEIPLLLEAVRFLAPLVIAAPPLTIDELFELMRRRINFLGLKGVAVFGLSAFDLAFHDLLCRRLSTSLGALLGQVRSSVRTYWSGLYVGADRSELEREVDRQLARGFRAFKMRVGDPEQEVDLERIALVTAALPDEALLAVDAVQAWTTERALEMVDALSGTRLAWIEDPVVHNDYRGLRQIVARSQVAIATGENEYLPEGFDQLFDANPRYLLPDLQRVGGISGWRRLTQRASDTTVVLTPHVYPHIALQLLSTLPYPSVHEYVPWWDPVSSYELEVNEGLIEVPDVVGCGLDFDPEAVERYAVSEWLPA